MKTSVELDEKLQATLAEAVSVIGEKPATVLRMAIRAGLPVVASRFAAPRPDGYFSDAYDLPKERRKLERAMSFVEQKPER
jgi:hypothetical protein